MKQGFRILWMWNLDEIASMIGARLPLRIRYWITLQQCAEAVYKTENGVYCSYMEMLDQLEKPRRFYG